MPELLAPPGAAAIRMDPADVTILEQPGLPALRSFITTAGEHYVLSALGVPRWDDRDWRVEVTGAVREPFTISLGELKSMPSKTLVVTMECAGDPLDPDKPVRRLSTARWTGVPLGDLLRRARPYSDDGYVWLDGADHGIYRPGTEFAERVEEYRKDLPMQRVVHGDVLVAYLMNDEVLLPPHGYPVRVVAPGYYGTNSVKWLTRVIVAPGRPSGLFCSVYYNELARVDGVVSRRQVGPIAVNSMLVSHTCGQEVAVGPQRFRGWAWGDREIEHVMLRTGEGRPWISADVGPRVDYAWQSFEIVADLPSSGTHLISVRATDVDGKTQPVEEHINQVATIELVAVSEPGSQ